MKKTLSLFLVFACVSSNAAWTLDGTQYLTDGNFRLRFAYVDSQSNPKTININDLSNAGGVYHDLEMSGIETDTGLRPVKYAAGGASGKKVANVMFPDTVTEITGSFENCAYTTNLVLPSNLISIGNFIFKNCKPTKCELILPEGLKTIGSSCFQNGGYTRIVISSTVETIGGSTFSGCTSVTNELVLPPGLTAIEGSTFSSSSFRGVPVVPAGVKYIGQSAFEKAKIDGVDFSQAVSLTNIYPFAFKECKNVMADFVFPSNLVSIASSGFQSSPFPGDVVVPRSLKSLAINAFSGCKFTSVDFTQAVNLEGLSGYAFSECPITNNLDLLNCNKLTYIQDRAFKKVNKPKEFILPDSVTNISGNVFADAGVNLEKVVLPKNLICVSVSPFQSWANSTTRRTAIYWRNCPKQSGKPLRRDKLKFSTARIKTRLQITFRNPSAGKNMRQAEPHSLLYPRMTTILRGAGSLLKQASLRLFSGISQEYTTKA